MDEQSKTIVTLIVVLLLLVGVAVGKNAGLFGKDEGELLPVNGNMVVQSTITDSVIITPYNGITMTDAYMNGNYISSDYYDYYDYSSLSEDDIYKTTESLDGVFGAFDTFGKIMSGVMITISVALLVIYVIDYKLYIKLGMPKNTAMWAVIVPFVNLVFSFLEVGGLATIWSLIGAIITIYLQFKFLQLIGINPWLMFTVLIPFAGFIFAIYLGVKQAINLGDMFRKGTGFKVGLFFLAPIFKGILAFSEKEQPQGIVGLGRNI